MPVKIAFKHQEVRASLQQVIRDLPGIVGPALRAESEIEATEAKLRTPVNTGVLRNSIHVEGPYQRGQRISCDIVAGGAAAEYAIIVHEDLEAHHTVGQAKYIESVINESAPHIAERLAVRIAKTLDNS